MRQTCAGFFIVLRLVFLKVYSRVIDGLPVRPDIDYPGLSNFKKIKGGEETGEGINKSPECIIQDDYALTGFRIYSLTSYDF